MGSQWICCIPYLSDGDCAVSPQVRRGFRTKFFHNFNSFVAEKFGVYYSLGWSTIIQQQFEEHVRIEKFFRLLDEFQSLGRAN